jgi:hypothetical protein
MHSDQTEDVTSSPSSSSSSVSSFFHPRIAVVLVVVNFLIHGLVLTGYFQADDWYNIEPRSVTQVARTFVGDWHAGRQGIGGFYRPLVRVSFSLDTLLYGLWAPGYHFTNLILHVLVVYLFFLLCNSLLGSQWGALGCALLFSAFPTHPEAIFWLSGRTDLIGAGFILLCAWSYVRYRLEHRRWAYGMALGAFAGALMSKETALAGILLLGVVEWLYNSGQNARSRAMARIRPLLPFLLILICYLCLRLIFLGGIGGYAVRPGEQAIGLLTLKQTYDAFANALAAPLRWCIPMLSKIGFIGFLIISVVLLWAVRFHRAAVLGFAWVLISVLPMLKLLPTVSEGGRLVYLPATGFCLFLGAAFWYGMRAQQVGHFGRVLIGAIFAIVLGSFALQTVQRNLEWKKASGIARTIFVQATELIRESGQDRHFALIGMPDNYRGCFVGRGDSPAQGLRVLLKHPAPALHIGFAPSDDSQSVVLRVDDTYHIRREAIHEIVRHQWSGEQLLAWAAGDGLTPLELRDGVAQTNIVSQPFSGLQSPPLHMEAMWVVVGLRQEITGGQYGKIYWRGPLETYSEERSTLIYNGGLRQFQDHHRNLGYVAQLEQLLIQPTDGYSRVAIGEIDVVGYRLASVAGGNPIREGEAVDGE